MLSLKENSRLAELHYLNVKDSIRKRISAIIAKNRFKFDKVSHPLNQDLVDLIEIYLDDNTLKSLITCTPANLDLLVTDLKNSKPDYLSKTSTVFKLLARVFIEHGYDKINNLNFIENIGIDTCPYCNRNYIYTLDELGKIKPEIDHFYPAGIYPLLAACYYNLIPSCQTCNGFGGKGKTDTYITGITNPYLLKGEEFKFRYTLNSLSIINPLSGKSSIDVVFEKSLQAHLEVFKLDKLYQMHSDHALELYVKSKLKYSPKYRAQLRNFKGLKYGEAEIDRLILGNYSKENELHKRPLSMLYRDLGKKLGLI